MKAPIRLPRRRWLRFSLGSLLLVITLMCAWCARTANEARKQARAVDLVRRLGGTVSFDYESGGLAHARYPLWLRDLLGDDYLATAHAVRLERRSVTDEDLKSIADLSELVFLDLGHTAVTDAGLKHVSNLTQLRTLVLRATACGDRGMKHLVKLQNLTDLDLRFTRVGDKGLAVARNSMTRLENLWLQGSQVSDAGLEGLKHLKMLGVISLAQTRVTSAGLRHLSGMSNLHWIMLSQRQLDERGIAHLKRLQGLRDLWIVPGGDWPTIRSQLKKELPRVRVAPPPMMAEDRASMRER